MKKNIVRQIGVLPTDARSSYQLCDDGNVWFFPSWAVEVNCGKLEAFLKAVSNGRWRIKLDEQKS